uniref:Uncharacterized protein n=1 Tax=Molossus molossus TaxID=27622 RepID=A0A7J8DCL2_MOLMO|nr:hypothetical protein HJG59_009395 [Molossus molossus]
MPMAPCLAVHWGSGAGVAMGLRAMVTDCGLTGDVLTARNGLGSASWGTDLRNLVYFFIIPPTHPPLSIHPIPLRNSTSLGHLGKALGQTGPQELGTFLCWACSTPEHAQKHARAQPRHVAVLRWLEGTRGQHVQFCWVNSTCRDVRD